MQVGDTKHCYIIISSSSRPHLKCVPTCIYRNGHACTHTTCYSDWTYCTGCRKLFNTRCLSFTHPHVVSHPYDLLSNMNHKRRYLWNFQAALFHTVKQDFERILYFSLFIPQIYYKTTFLFFLQLTVSSSHLLSVHEERIFQTPRVLRWNFESQTVWNDIRVSK